MQNNKYALPRPCVIWESLHEEKPGILHKIIVFNDAVWGVVEEKAGTLQKFKISRVRLVPIGGESESLKR